jgi:uncharacterized protein DUF6777
VAGQGASGLNRYRIFVGITAGAAALILLITQVVGGDDEGELEGQAEEVQLEPISYTPPDPFTEPLTPETAPPDSTPETAVDTPLSGDALLPVEPASPGAVRSASAETVGLYGGSLNYSRCHRQKLVDFLGSSPRKAQAWVDVLNSDPTLYWSGGRRLTTSDIRTYVFELTPVLLRSDTWVTNHGYSNGRAYPIQSVLQAGTAVLVDAYGVPRTKCYCGNPLLPPRRFRPVYRGQRWPGFDGRKVIIVTRSVTIIDRFTLYDVETGVLYGRRAGTEGTEDVRSEGQPTPGPSGLTVPPDVELGTGDVQVTLLWNSGADLDLHVTDPQGSEIYFGQPTSPSGGQIDHDDTAGCGTRGTHVENIFWPEGTAPSGSYEAFVSNFTGCGEASTFDLRVTVAGNVVYQDGGTLSEGEPMTPVTFTV